LNRQIGRIFGLFALLFTVLIGFTSQWSIFEAEGLENNPANRRSLLEAETIPRGVITAADGEELAVSEEVASGEEPRFERRYPQGALFSHEVGYFFTDAGTSGLERFYDDDLAGRGDELENLFGDIFEQDEGDDLATNLDSEAQRTAIDALSAQGDGGAVVALEPDTGKVRVMASLPDFDPNTVPDQIDELNQSEDSLILNRATQARYQPGSTFKVVTTAAALDTGEFTPESVLDGSSPKIIGGTPLENAGGESFGAISLTDALTNSVNTVFAQVGEQLGSETLFDYMERFGLGRAPPIDYPADQLFASGVYEDDELLGGDDPVDAGRVAIGQERLQVTPLQMAMVAAAVANDGSLMAPRLGDAIMAPDGRVKDRISSSEASQVMSTETADALTEMMTNVVQEGTGTAAALQGIDVAGKTGTAETGDGDQAWFIAFAPSDDPQIAIAVTVEPPSGFGGEVAAPIASQVLEVLLANQD
jgi:peptidoglycan glycosyltransferase